MCNYVATQLWLVMAWSLFITICLIHATVISWHQNYWLLFSIILTRPVSTLWDRGQKCTFQRSCIICIIAAISSYSFWCIHHWQIMWLSLFLKSDDFLLCCWVLHYIRWHQSFSVILCGQGMRGYNILCNTISQLHL